LKGRAFVWWLVGLLLFALLLALSPTLASVIVALVLVGLLVWRSALHF
jgi:hypothetical protein